MRQDPEEPFHTFSTNVQGKAEACEFKTSFESTCTTCDAAYSGQTYYTDEMVRDVLLTGVADFDIRREALRTDGMQISEIIAFIESKETVRNANPSSGITTISACRQHQKSKSPDDKAQIRRRPTRTDREETALCPNCGKTFNAFSKEARGWNAKSHLRCEPCWKIRRNGRRLETSLITCSGDDCIGQIAGVSSHPKGGQLRHQIFIKGDWRRPRTLKHPEVSLKLHNDSSPLGPVDVLVIADTGAQSDLWSLEAFISAGFTKQDLSPVSLSLYAANRSPIRISGTFYAVLAGRSTDSSTMRH